MQDELGDRMKMYEVVEAGRRFMPLLPIIARIDGRTFSSFTRGLARPFDKRLSDLMIATTAFLAKETNASIGYTQSDEITLVWYSTEIKSQVFFDGKIQKMNSQLSALATAFFLKGIIATIPEKAHLLPTFDSRVWQVPTQKEACACLLWRELDASKNSISMATRAHFSTKAMMGKKSAEMHDMLHSKGVNWNDYPTHFKRGSYIQRRKVITTFSPAELEKLPEKHAARTNPGLQVERQIWDVIELPRFASLENPCDVVFKGAAPKIKKNKMDYTRYVIGVPIQNIRAENGFMIGHVIGLDAAAAKLTKTYKILKKF